MANGETAEIDANFVFNREIGMILQFLQVTKFSGIETNLEFRFLRLRFLASLVIEHFCTFQPRQIR